MSNSGFHETEKPKRKNILPHQKANTEFYRSRHQDIQRVAEQYSREQIVRYLLQIENDVSFLCEKQHGFKLNERLKSFSTRLSIAKSIIIDLRQGYEQPEFTSLIEVVKELQLHFEIDQLYFGKDQILADFLSGWAQLKGQHLPANPTKLIELIKNSKARYRGLYNRILSCIYIFPPEQWQENFTSKDTGLINELVEDFGKQRETGARFTKKPNFALTIIKYLAKNHIPTDLAEKILEAIQIWSNPVQENQYLYEIPESWYEIFSQVNSSDSSLKNGYLSRIIFHLGNLPDINLPKEGTGELFQAEPVQYLERMFNHIQQIKRWLSNTQVKYATWYDQSDRSLYRVPPKEQISGIIKQLLHGYKKETDVAGYILVENFTGIKKLLSWLDAIDQVSIEGLYQVMIADLERGVDIFETLKFHDPELQIEWREEYSQWKLEVESLIQDLQDSLNSISRPEVITTNHLSVELDNDDEDLDIGNRARKSQNQ